MAAEHVLLAHAGAALLRHVSHCLPAKRWRHALSVAGDPALTFGQRGLTPASPLAEPLTSGT